MWHLISDWIGFKIDVQSVKDSYEHHVYTLWIIQRSGSLGMNINKNSPSSKKKGGIIPMDS